MELFHILLLLATAIVCVASWWLLRSLDKTNTEERRRHLMVWAFVFIAMMAIIWFPYLVVGATIAV